jgi:hypothetical protein
MVSIIALVALFPTLIFAVPQPIPAEHGTPVSKAHKPTGSVEAGEISDVLTAALAKNKTTIVVTNEPVPVFKEACQCAPANCGSNIAKTDQQKCECQFANAMACWYASKGGCQKPTNVRTRLRNGCGSIN